MKKLRYLFEAAILFELFLAFKFMPPYMASEVGGMIGRMIGPRLKASRKAYRNLNESIPGLTPERQKQIITGMWENLGRIIAEYPHLEKITRDNTKIFNYDRIPKDKPAIIFGGHLGNWEINTISSFVQKNRLIDATYRAPNNPWADKLLMHARTLGGKIPAHSKSRKGGRQMIKALKSGSLVCILMDQKYNEGIAADFFGRPAMTNPAFVTLCQKYNAALIPMRNIRTRDANFEFHVYEEIPVFDENNNPLPVETIIAQAHTLLESWIKEKPEQWLWLHRRWDSKAFN